ncbi:MAG: hypothetical protein M3373_09905 [Gemmatimonadota bacterium]|nr:hypothetical protein [Gemmatimonadota bacterium]
MYRFMRIGALGATLVFTAACGGNDARDAATTDTSPGTLDRPAVTLRVTDVQLGRTMGADNRIADETDDFGPNDTIHAVVAHEGAAAGTSITARWTFEDGQVVDERTETVSPTGATTEYTHFMVAKPSGWPRGEYRLHILVNGREVETEEFEVK